MPSFQELADLYKDHLIRYRVSGDLTAKSTYETAQRGMDAYIQSLKNDVDHDQVYIQQFMDSYTRTDGELVELHNQSQKIQHDGPIVQDKYNQSKELNGVNVLSPDNTSRAIKASVILILMLSLGFLTR